MIFTWKKNGLILPRHGTSMRVQQGYILIVVLLFMQLCTLLGLYALEASWIENKLAQLVWKKQKFQDNIEEILRKSEEKLVDQLPDCLIAQISTDELMKQPITWWQKQSCTGNFQSIQYYYVVEPLGEDPCAHIKRKRAAHADYYRLTLLGTTSASRAVIQSTFIRAVTTSDHCENVTHMVDMGRQSWSNIT